MKKQIVITLIMLLCLLTALPLPCGLAEDDELSYELAHDLPTGIEEDDELSYELAHDLPTGIEEDDELSYELAHDLPTGIEEDEELSYELAHDLPTGIEEDDELSYELAHDLPTGIETLYAYVWTANGKGLNMRAEANGRGRVITVIPYGERVLITGYYNNQWAAVVYGSHNGYCMTRHLSETSPYAAAPGYSPAESASTALNVLFNSLRPVAYTATVIPSTAAGSVNLRWAPATNAPIQATYHNGDVLAVLAEGGGWAQVYDGSAEIAGFMMSQYLARVHEYGTAGSSIK